MSNRKKIPDTGADLGEGERREWQVYRGKDILYDLREPARSALAQLIRPDVLYADVTGFAAPQDFRGKEPPEAFVPIGADVPGFTIIDGRVRGWTVPPLPFDNSGWGTMQTEGLLDRQPEITEHREADRDLIMLNGSKYAAAAREGYARDGRGLILVSTVEELPRGTGYGYIPYAAFAQRMADYGPRDMPLDAFTDHNNALRELAMSYDPEREYILRITRRGGPTGILLSVYRQPLEPAEVG